MKSVTNRGSIRGIVWFVVLLMAALFLAACQPVQPVETGASPTIPEINVELNDDGFVVPAQVPTGLVKFIVTNNSAAAIGGDILFARLKPGKTMDDAGVAMESDDPNVFFSVADLLGGATGVQYLRLSPGDYFVFYADEEDTPVQPIGFTAEGPAGTSPDPAAGVDVQLVDFSFIMPDTVAAGPQLWHISNQGSQWHHVVIAKLNDGATAEELLNWALAETPEGPPPAEFLAGWAPASPGMEGWVQFDLPAGDYVAVCFLPDFSAMPPMSHAAHGMVHPFTIQ